jgi:hypothetical protein
MLSSFIFKTYCFTFEDGTNMWSQSIGHKLPFYAAYNSKRTQISRQTWLLEVGLLVYFD